MVDHGQPGRRHAHAGRRLAAGLQRAAHRGRRDGGVVGVDIDTTGNDGGLMAPASGNAMTINRADGWPTAASPASRTSSL